MSSLKKLNVTDFKCAICTEILIFDTSNPETFLSKSDSEDFFSMKLERYVVKHDIADEEHINVVIVDQNHKYRGHKDYYVNRKRFVRTAYNMNVIDPLITHTKLDYLIMINLSTKEIVEYINANVPKIHSLSLCEKVADFIFQNKELYTSLPEKLTYEHANKKFFIIKKTENMFLLCSFYHPESYKEYVKVLHLLCNVISNSYENIAFTLILLASDTFNLDLQAAYPYLEWIVTENLIYVSISLNSSILSDIKILLSRLQYQSSCTRKFEFLEIFEGKTTILEYLQKNIQDLCCVKDTLDLIKHRIEIS